MKRGKINKNSIQPACNLSASIKSFIKKDRKKPACNLPPFPKKGSKRPPPTLKLKPIKKRKRPPRKGEGRPTKYIPKYAEIAEVACSEGGYTDAKLARLFGTCRATIALWKQEYPKFSDAIKKGKDDWDSSKVENSLLRRAMGYKYLEVTRKWIAVKNKQGEIVGHEFKTTKTVKKDTAPDTGACIIWLTNRRSARWQNKRYAEATVHHDPNILKQLAEILPD